MPIRNTPPMLIGLTGLARSGKDTVGSHLVAEHGYTRVAFGDGVREAALALDPIISAQIPHPDQAPEYLRLSHLVDDIGWERAKTYSEVRRTLQRMGTEAGWMMHGLDLWVDLAAGKVCGPTVFTDVRFAHEADWITSRGGQIWQVRREAAGLAGATGGHLSEAGIGRDPDLIIHNDGSLAQLHARVDQTLAWLT